MTGGWIDMTRYPDFDPDHAVDESRLDALRDALHVTDRIPAAAWDRLLANATSDTGTDPADGPHATGTNPAADRVGENGIAGHRMWSSDPVRSAIARVRNGMVATPRVA